MMVARAVRCCRLKKMTTANQPMNLASRNQHRREKTDLAKGLNTTLDLK
jgi:hypothetical protein